MIQNAKTSLILMCRYLQRKINTYQLSINTSSLLKYFWIILVLST